MSEALYTIPYFSKVAEIEHPTVTAILYNFVRYANGKRGYLDVNPFHGDGTPIPLTTSEEGLHFFGKRLSWNLGAEREPYNELNAKEWGNWVTEFSDNTLICDEYAVISFDTFYSKDIASASVLENMRWLVQDGRIEPLYT